MSESAIRLLMTDAGQLSQPAEWTALIERAATGDSSAFEQIMLRTERRVIGTARRILGNSADAEEAAQEVFLRVYKYLHRIDRSKSFDAWLYRITINVCNDIASSRPLTQEILSEPAGDFHDMNDALEVAEQRKIIQTALSNLPEQQRAAVVLRDLQGLSTAETAEAMNVSEGTVRSHLSSARLRLKEFVQKRMRRSR